MEGEREREIGKKGQREGDNIKRETVFRTKSES
jgi:hypothetical protein